MRKNFMICVDNRGYKSSLETRKIYEVLTDKAADQHRQLRVVDESGEDYLYPENFFAPVTLPPATKRRLKLARA
jgi:hypothetical protein